MSSDRSILDARLAEIDRRLRTIQTGLAPVAEAAPEVVPTPLVPTPLVPTPLVPSAPDAAPAPAPAPAVGLPRDRGPEPDAAPAPAAARPAEAAPAGSPELEQALRDARALTAELRELRDEHAQVIAAARSLLSQLAEQLGREPVTLADGAASGPAAHVPLAAGPFRDAAALRQLAEAIRDLPRVTAVEVREFVGRDHAVLDVAVDPAPE